jgi:hypothetical protein
MRIGRIGPFSKHAQERSVCGERLSQWAAHAVGIWVRVSLASPTNAALCCDVFEAIEESHESLEETYYLSTGSNSSPKKLIRGNLQTHEEECSIFQTPG